MSSNSFVVFFISMFDVFSCNFISFDKFPNYSLVLLMVLLNFLSLFLSF